MTCKPVKIEVAFRLLIELTELSTITYTSERPISCHCQVRRIKTFQLRMLNLVFGNVSSQLQRKQHHFATHATWLCSRTLETLQFNAKHPKNDLIENSTHRRIFKNYHCTWPTTELIPVVCFYESPLTSGFAAFYTRRTICNAVFRPV